MTVQWCWNYDYEEMCHGPFDTRELALEDAALYTISNCDPKAPMPITCLVDGEVLYEVTIDQFRALFGDEEALVSIAAQRREQERSE